MVVILVIKVIGAITVLTGRRYIALFQILFSDDLIEIF